MNEVRELSKKYFAKVKEHREHLHKHPELSFQEYQTSKYISSVLDSIGIPFKDNLGNGTGITAELGQGEKVIAVRADIDALPITEEGTHSYISSNVGVMHACGHDVHTSCLLGTAYILKELEERLPCRVRLIFQPGEEKLPGGASLMIKDGVLEDVVAIIGQHVHPDLQVGQIGHGTGYFMASCDELYITVEGRGGHAAMPEKVIDPILISAEIIQSLQTVISRKANPNTPTVLSIGKINSDGGATNVIPERVVMEGTFRTYDEVWRKQAYQHIEDIVTSICQAHGATAKVNIVRGYPSLYNNPEISNIVAQGIRVFLTEEDAIEIAPRMTAEDFSYYSHEVPACFYRLGTSSSDGSKTSPVHTPTFDIDPKSLEIGMGFMAYITLKMADNLTNAGV